MFDGWKCNQYLDSYDRSDLPCARVCAVADLFPSGLNITGISGISKTNIIRNLRSSFATRTYSQILMSWYFNNKRAQTHTHTQHRSNNSSLCLVLVNNKQVLFRFHFTISCFIYCILFLDDFYSLS